MTEIPSPTPDSERNSETTPTESQVLAAFKVVETILEQQDFPLQAASLKTLREGLVAGYASDIFEKHGIDPDALYLDILRNAKGQAKALAALGSMVEPITQSQAQAVEHSITEILQQFEKADISENEDDGHSQNTKGTSYNSVAGSIANFIVALTTSIRSEKDKNIIEGLKVDIDELVKRYASQA